MVLMEDPHENHTMLNHGITLTREVMDQEVDQNVRNNPCFWYMSVQYHHCLLEFHLFACILSS